MAKERPTYNQRVAAVKGHIEEGIPVKSLCSMFSMEQTAVYRWIKKFKETGNYESLKSNHGGGRKPKLTTKDINKLIQFLLNPATKYGFENDLWTLNRVIILCEKKIKKKVSKNLVWRMLRKNKFFYKSIEKSYEQGDDKELEEWLSNRLPEIIKDCKRKQGIMYFLDESNVQLSKVSGKSWAPAKKRPEVKVTGKRGSISAISAISKSGFLLFDLHDGRINSDKVLEFLEKMRKHHPNRHLYIFMDNAPVHTANKIKDYENKHKRIHIENIPRYWPKYNPDEFVWNYLKNVEMNVYSAGDKEELKKMVTEKLEKIASCTKTLKGIFYRCKLALHL